MRVEVRLPDDCEGLESDVGCDMAVVEFVEFARGKKGQAGIGIGRMDIWRQGKRPGQTIGPEKGEGLKRRKDVRIVEQLTLARMGLDDSNEFVMVTGRRECRSVVCFGGWRSGRQGESYYRHRKFGAWVRALDGQAGAPKKRGRAGSLCGCRSGCESWQQGARRKVGAVPRVSHLSKGVDRQGVSRDD